VEDGSLAVLVAVPRPEDTAVVLALRLLPLGEVKREGGREGEDGVPAVMRKSEGAEETRDGVFATDRKCTYLCRQSETRLLDSTFFGLANENALP